MPPEFKEQWPRRPPRLARLFDTARPFYFVTFNTYKRRRFLARPEVHETFCVFCSKAQEHAVAVGRYAIMPDHVHLFAAFPIDGITLPSWIKSLRSVIGKTLLSLGVHKPHWQEGFFDHLLRSYALGTATQNPDAPSWIPRYEKSWLFHDRQKFPEPSLSAHPRKATPQKK